MTLGELSGITTKVSLPNGEEATVYRVDHNLAHAVNGYVQCIDGGWIKARNLTVIDDAALATMPEPIHDHSQGIAFCPHCSPRIGDG